MKLMTKEIEKKIPPMDSVDSDNPKIAVKFFDPFSSWTWYVIEGEKIAYNRTGDDGKEYHENDWLFFGYVKGFENELGYFRLNELQSVGRIERDLYFEGNLKDVK